MSPSFPQGWMGTRVSAIFRQRLRDVEMQPANICILLKGSRTPEAIRSSLLIEVSNIMGRQGTTSFPTGMCQHVPYLFGNVLEGSSLERGMKAIFRHLAPQILVIFGRPCHYHLICCLLSLSAFEYCILQEPATTCLMHKTPESRFEEL